MAQEELKEDAKERREVVQDIKMMKKKKMASLGQMVRQILLQPTLLISN